MAIDDSLVALERADIVGEIDPRVSYRLGNRLGEGGFSVAFYAMRLSPEGKAPVVIKLLKPSFVREADEAARLLVQKEAVALGRLNERVPPTPFVVRLIDAGNAHVFHEGAELALPWLAVEYVRGGPEGTTLRERVRTSLRVTGCAFDGARALRAIECISSGLQAVHEVGVIHRDIKPDNILCCGFGEDELFKVADFGIARPLGMAGTFGGLVVGTPGYAAPELTALDQHAIGAWSDVFALAAVVFFILTGEEYFPAQTPAQAIRLARERGRPLLRDQAGLAPELRERERTCTALDRILARATGLRPEDRPQSAEGLASEIVPLLTGDSKRGRPSQLLRSSVGVENTVVDLWSWIVRREPSDDIYIRSVAWDGDGTCLVASNHGLRFWEGTEWGALSYAADLPTQGIRFVRRQSPGVWWVGGDEATFARLTLRGVADIIRGPDCTRSFRLFAGDPEEVAVLTSVGAEGTSLHAMIARKWLKALPLDGVANISAITRLDEDRFLIAGASVDRRAWAGIYRPLEWSIEPLVAPNVRAFTAAAALTDLSAAVVVGTNGVVLWHDGTNVMSESVPEGADLSAATIDISGRGWIAGAAGIWIREVTASGPRWRRFWNDPKLTTPIVSLYAESGRVIAVTVDAGVIEGQGRVR